MSHPPEIRVVFFDIGNVLLRFDIPKIIRKMAWALRSNPLRIARYLSSSELVSAIEKGEVTGRELHRRFKAELGYREDYAAFRLFWCDHFTLDAECAEILRGVAKGRKVFLLSNTNQLHYDFIKQNYAFAGHAHGAVLSYKLGLRKPEPAIYLAALKRARVKPEQAFFVDDLKENVEAAAKAGIHAWRYGGAAGLRKELERLGVKAG